VVTIVPEDHGTEAQVLLVIVDHQHTGFSGWLGGHTTHLQNWVT
jgi:hypothetical protein